MLLGAELAPAPERTARRLRGRGCRRGSTPGAAVRDDVPRTAVAGRAQPRGDRARRRPRAAARCPPRSGLLRGDPAPALRARPRAARRGRPGDRLLGGRDARSRPRRVPVPPARRSTSTAPPAPEGEQLDCVAAIALQRRPADELGHRGDRRERALRDAPGGLGGQALRCARALRAAGQAGHAPGASPSRGAPRSRPTRRARRSRAAGWTAASPRTARCGCDVWAGRVLSRRERELFAALSLPDRSGGSSGWRRERPPRSAWPSCSPRLTASSCRRPTSRSSRTSAGRPVVHVAALERAARPPFVSLSHTGGAPWRWRCSRPTASTAWGSTSSCFPARPRLGPGGASPRRSCALLEGLDGEGRVAAAPLVRPRGGGQGARDGHHVAREHQPRARRSTRLGATWWSRSAHGRWWRAPQRDGDLVVASALSASRGPGGGGTEMSAIRPARDGRHPGAAGRSARRLGVRRARSAPRDTFRRRPRARVAGDRGALDDGPAAATASCRSRSTSRRSASGPSRSAT